MRLNEPHLSYLVTWYYLRPARRDAAGRFVYEVHTRASCSAVWLAQALASIRHRRCGNSLWAVWMGGQSSWR